MSIFRRIRRAVTRRIPRQVAIRYRLLRERNSAASRRADREAEAFLISYPKCGRTWLRMLLSRALENHYGAPDIDYLGGDFLGGNVAGAPRIRVSHDDDPHWKTPRGLDRRKRRYRDKKVVLLVRDPRDVVVSMYFERSRRERAYSGTLSQFLQERRGSLDTILAYYNVWAGARHIPSDLLVVRYEDLRRDTERELRRLLDFLGVADVSDETVREAVHFASFENMRKMESTGSVGSGRLRPRDPNAKIPPNSPQAVVLASVPDTAQAELAMVASTVPTTATVSRREAKIELKYDGEPKFKPIEGTTMSYAINAQPPVIKTGDQYYAVDDGVWFVASSPIGPWEVATEVPEEIYTIPPSSPVYYATFAHVYDAGEENVEVGYTPGYTGTYEDDGTVVYGTGWYYEPWYGDYYYGFHRTGAEP